MADKITTAAFSIQTDKIYWEYAKAQKPKGNALRLAILSFILGIIAISLGSYGMSWDAIRGSILLGIGFFSFILGIVMLIIHNNQMKISWNIDFNENSLVLSHQLPKSERKLEISYAEIEKIQLRFFSKKQKVSDKEHLTEVSSWGRGNYYSPVLETPTQVINLMELGRKEDQECLVNYLNQEIRTRKIK